MVRLAEVSHLEMKILHQSQHASRRLDGTVIYGCLFVGDVMLGEGSVASLLELEW